MSKIMFVQRTQLQDKLNIVMQKWDRNDQNALFTFENYGGYSNRFFWRFFQLAKFFSGWKYSAWQLNSAAWGSTCPICAYLSAAEGSTCRGETSNCSPSRVLLPPSTSCCLSPPVPDNSNHIQDYHSHVKRTKTKTEQLKKSGPK